MIADILLTLSEETETRTIHPRLLHLPFDLLAFIRRHSILRNVSKLIDPV